jgi:hydrogenase nickel incorporation protein HypA/HybF
LHELAITQSIVDQVADATEGTRVTGVSLEIGRLSGVVADSVRFCFDLVTDGTALDGAILQIVDKPGKGHCLTCGRSFPLEDLIILCPCGSADVRVVDGRQLLIKSVQVVWDDVHNVRVWWKFGDIFLSFRPSFSQPRAQRLAWSRRRATITDCGSGAEGFGQEW